MSFVNVRYVASPASDPDMLGCVGTVVVLRDSDTVSNTVPTDGWTGLLGGVPGTMRTNANGELEFLIAAGPPPAQTPPATWAALILRLRNIFNRLTTHETRLSALETRVTATEAAITVLQNPPVPPATGGIP